MSLPRVLSILVGQSLGRNDVAGARCFTRQTIVVLLLYTLLLGLVFFLWPHGILRIFLLETGGQSSPALLDQGVVILRIIALFIAFDAMYFTLVGTLKGAGDTRFIMGSIGLATALLMVIPMTIIVEFTDWGLYTCWINLSFYVLALFTLTFWRYRQGAWQKIRVI